MGGGRSLARGVELPTDSSESGGVGEAALPDPDDAPAPFPELVDDSPIVRAEVAGLAAEPVVVVTGDNVGLTGDGYWTGFRGATVVREGRVVRVVRVRVGGGW